MKTNQATAMPLPQREAHSALSLVHGQPLIDMEELLQEHSFALKAAAFLNEVQLSQEFWDTRKNPIEDQVNLGLAMAAVHLHLQRITVQAHQLELKKER